MRTKSKWFGALAILTILALVLSGCGAAATPQVVKETVEVVKEVEKVVEQTVVVEKEVEKVVEVVVTPTPDPAAVGAEPVTLNFIFGSEPPTIDPALTTDTTSVWLVEQMFLALTDYDDDTLEVIPELATDWDISEDGLVYTFHLRDDAKWVQLVGEEVVEIGPVTANDVVYGILRTLDPATAASYSYVPTTVLVGAEEYAFADSAATAEELQALRDGVGVKALDDYTVEYTLKQPAAYFPAMTSLWIFRPQPQAAIEEWGDRWIEPGLIVTNGPYMLKEWGHGSHLMLVKNPLWYDADMVQIEVLDAPIVSEASTGMAMYENGEIDYAGDPGWGPPLVDMDRIKADATLSAEFNILPRLCTYYYGFVNSKAPMDNALVRKAFSYAIDRQTLIDTLLKGEQKPANSFTCPGIFGSVGGDPDVGLLYDPEMARQSLADAGYPNGEGLPPITFMINQSEAHLQIAQAIQAMWKEVLNVEVNLEQQEWAVYLETLKPGSPDEDKPHIFRMGWCADYLDANNFLADVLHSMSGENYSKFNNPDFDALIEQAQVESDPEVRLDLYKQAEIILNNEVTGIAPIYFYTNVTLNKPYLTRITNPLAMDHVYKWTIDWEAKQAATGR